MQFVDPTVQEAPERAGARDDAPGFLTFERSDYVLAHVTSPDDAHWQALKHSYADLSTDRYLRGGETYRLRRFGRYLYASAPDILVDLEHAPFYQSRDYNPLHGGVHRLFEPLAPETRRNPVLRRLIRFHVAQCGLMYPQIHDWLVYVHQIRILGNGGSVGQPTPEGLHQDGHHVVAQVLVARENVCGAESTVCDEHRAPLLTQVLRHELDTIVVDDRMVWHGVTPLQCVDPRMPAYRDMLLIDFNPIR